MMRRKKQFIERMKTTNIGNVVFRQMIKEEETDKSFRLRYEFYVEKRGWEPPNPEKMEIDRWDEFSYHFGAFQDEEPIAISRIIDGRAIRLPIESVVREINEQEVNAEISRVIITNSKNENKSKSISDLKLFLGLFVEMYKFCTKEKIKNFYITVPKKQFKQWTVFGFDMLQQIGAPFAYKKNMYVAAWTNLEQIHNFFEEHIKILEGFL